MNKIFLFVGAGASAELGVPTMGPMVDEFWSYLSRTSLSQDQIELLQDDLAHSSKDMEAIIQDAKQMVDAGNTAAEYSADIGGPEYLDLFKKLLREAEWFVQNACRRVDYSYARLLWEPTLKSLSDRDFVIATTNYDRAIEIAGKGTANDVTDGFDQFGNEETVEWVGIDEDDRPMLLKTHGSLDWFRTGEGIVKLRHPLSLYGDMEVVVNGDEQLKNCIILPSMEKKKNETPFVEINTQMRLEAQSSELALFLGSSLRDPDISSLVNQCKEVMPTYTITPGESPFDGDVLHISASASEFLMSILPVAASQANIQDRLDEEASQERDPTFILEHVHDAFSEDSSQRPGHIEYLADNKIELQASQVRQLLDDDSDRVRLYSLALVDNCSDPEALMDAVEDLAENDASEAVQAEADLLMEYM